MVVDFVVVYEVFCGNIGEVFMNGFVGVRGV